LNLYITNREMPPLCGMVMLPENMVSKLSHLMLASNDWDALYIDVVEVIPEGALKHLAKKCSEIYVACPEKPTLHQLHLLIELFPYLDGKLRKAYMRGDNVHGLLPKMWQYGDENRRNGL